MARITRTSRYMIGTAHDLGCDPEGGKWTRVCLIHQTLMNFPTQRSAKSHSIPINDGCEGCEWGLTREAWDAYWAYPYKGAK